MKIGIDSDTFTGPEGVKEVIRNSDAELYEGDTEALAGEDLELILVSGWKCIRELVELRSSAPLLVVEEPIGLRAIKMSTLGSAIESIIAGEYSIQSHPGFTIESAGLSTLGLSTGMVMTTEAATISEYAVRCNGYTVALERADGFVVATPAGSCEYARAAGGPILDPAIPGSVIVPIAPYRTDPDHWVVSGDIEIEVVRDSGAVGVFVDGKQVETLSRGQSISIQPGESFEIVHVADSRSPYTVYQSL